MKTLPRLRLLLALSLLAVAAACGDSSKVGSDDLTNFKEKEQGKLGTTSTTAPPETTAPPTTAQGAVTTAKNVTTTTASKAPSLQITIQSDSKGSAFQPTVGKVLQGTVVRWNNTDSVPRSVVSDDEQSFDSGPIAPGAFYDYTATRVGTFNYHDGTRPYAVASLQVVSR